MENKFLKFYIIILLIYFNILSFSFSDIITGVDISGNHEISSEELILLIKSQTGNIFSPEILQDDINRIYSSGFFADVGADTEKQAGGIRIRFKVIENSRISDIFFSGTKVFSERVLKKIIKSQIGQVFNFNTLKKDIQEIERFYSSKGYVLSRVHDVNVSDDGSRLEFIISEPVIESIVISGNNETSAEIIRKKIGLNKGSIYNYHELVKGIDELRKIEAFEDIRFFVNSGKTVNRVVIAIELKEKKTGEIDFGISYGEFNGFVGSVSFEKKNFRGKAEKLKFTTEFGEVKNYDFSYTVPYILQDLTGRLNIFDYSIDKEKYNNTGLYQYDYTEKRDGFRFILGKSLEKKSFEYEFISEDVNVRFPGTDINVTRDWLKYRGSKVLSNGSFSWETGVTGKSFLNGDHGYFTYMLERSVFFRQEKKTEAVRIKIENISESENALHEFEKVSVGGRDSLRGYKSSVFSSDNYILLNLEERLKVNQKLWYVIFSDMAHINGDLKKTFGVGFAFYSPLGIIRLDYGKPVDDKNYKKGRIYLGIGYMFQ